ncbi:MAG TPA: response regulator transcription factor [Acidimicrobiales bacterium]|nr:response regulator transcription factor [Acidimicrobiales bacterium]
MTGLRVLVVEDYPPARELLVALLEDEGYTVVAVGDGPAALEAVATFRPDVALVDGGLPGMSGPDVVRRLRQDGDLPIIFVTGADSEADIHGGFRVGADDYIVKPYDPEELSWRVRAVLRRTGRVVLRAWDCGDLRVDEGAHVVTRAGAPVELTAIEFRLLTVLVRSGNRVVRPKEFFDRVWGYDAGDHLLQVHMSSLRRKIEAHGPRMIHTVHATGYALRP